MKPPASSFKLRACAPVFLRNFCKVITGIILTTGMPEPSIAGEVIWENYLSAPDAAKNLNLKPSQWKIEGDEILSVNAIKGMDSFEFGAADWNDYEINFKVRRLTVNSTSDQHFGVFVRNSPDGGVRLFSRGNSIVYIADSRSSVLGNFAQPMPVGDDAPWTAFRIVVKGRQIEVYAENALVGTIDAVELAAGKICFYAYHVDIAIKDLAVRVSRTGEKNTVTNANSKNILHNSSFEQCTLDDLPDYWGAPHWGLADPYWATHFKEWQQNFITDNTTAHDGKRSMRITNPDNKPNICPLWSVCVGAKMNETYTLSAYMKSEPAGLKVKLGNAQPGDKEETFTLTGEWQRYSTVFLKDKNSRYADMICITPQNKGVVWIDSVQLENGPLTAYQPMKNENQQLQTEEGNVNKVLTEVPKYEPPYYDRNLVLTGNLNDKIWEQIPKMKFVTSAGDRVKDPTEAQVWYNDKGIYIGVKCFDVNAGKNTSAVTARDGSVWNDPSLEFFIDPQLSRNYYYHLAVNQIGTQYDGFCSDMSWNGNWKAVTYTDPEGKYWSAEIFLPFGELGIDPTASDRWGFNICRENHFLKEYSCWSPTYASFHTPTRFGQISIDRKVQEHYFMGCDEAQFQRISDNSASLVLTLFNNTGRGQVCELSARLTDQMGKEIAQFSKSVNVKNGGKQAIDLGNLDCETGAKYRLALCLRNDRGDLCYSGVKNLETPEILSVLTQYDVYTREDKMLTRVQLNQGHKLKADTKLTLKVYDSAGKEVLCEAVDKLQQEIEKGIDIKNLGIGDYTLKAELKTGDGVFAASKGFRKLTPEKTEVKTDHFSRMATVNGTPFFPIGLALEGNATPDCIKYYAESGANNVYLTVNPIKHPDLIKIMDAAVENDVKLQIQYKFPRDDKARKFTAEHLQSLKDHPAVLAWLLQDEEFTGEWGKNNYPAIMAGFKEFQQMDPYHPVIGNENSYGLSFLKTKKLDFPGEVISLDHYVYPPAGSLQQISTYAKSIEAAGRKDGKPCWIFLNGGGYTFWASRDLTPAEQEFETYAAIINGVRGVTYFADHPKSNAHWERMKGLFREIKELTPALASTAKAPMIKCSTPAIEFLVKRNGDGVYLIAVNNSTDPVNARFDLSEIKNPGGHVEARFENRKVNVSKKVIADTFGGFQRHVYLIKE